MENEKWEIGKTGGTVITDSNEGFPPNTGHIGEGALKYYGGNLVCESIAKKKYAKLIAAAPPMLGLLKEIQSDSRTILEFKLRINDIIQKIET